MPRFEFLGQTQYKDSNGRDCPATDIVALAPYKHICDGFYQWECGQCGQKHASRSCGWPISGQVLECDKCKSLNLLVRTNCQEIDQSFGLFLQMEERDKELKRLQNIEQEFNNLKSNMAHEISHKVYEKLRKFILHNIDDIVKEDPKQ